MQGWRIIGAGTFALGDLRPRPGAAGWSMNIECRSNVPCSKFEVRTGSVEAAVPTPTPNPRVSRSTVRSTHAYCLFAILFEPGFGGQWFNFAYHLVHQVAETERHHHVVASVVLLLYGLAILNEAIINPVRGIRGQPRAEAKPLLA